MVAETKIKCWKFYTFQKSQVVLKLNNFNLNNHPSIYQSNHFLEIFQKSNQVCQKIILLFLMTLHAQIPSLFNKRLEYIDIESISMSLLRTWLGYE